MHPCSKTQCSSCHQSISLCHILSKCLSSLSLINLPVSNCSSQLISCLVKRQVCCCPLHVNGKLIFRKVPLSAWHLNLLFICICLTSVLDKYTILVTVHVAYMSNEWIRHKCNAKMYVSEKTNIQFLQAKIFLNMKNSWTPLVIWTLIKTYSSHAASVHCSHCEKF